MMRNAALLASCAAVGAWAAVLPSDASKFTMYEMPTAGSGPCDLCTGPDGAIWIQDVLTNKVARLDKSTGAIEEFDIPYTYPLHLNETLPAHSALACAIQPGNDGNVYAATGLRNQFVQIKLPEKTLKVFTPEPYDPLGDLIFLNDQFAGPDGQYFTQTTNNKLTKFDYQTEQITQYDFPHKLSGPVGVFNPPADPKAIWSAEFLGQRIARFDTDSHEFTNEYTVPPTLLGPAVVRSQTSDGAMWFTATDSMALGRVNLTTGAMEAHIIPYPLSVPLENTVDGQDRVWYSVGAQDALEYYDTRSGQFGKVQQPGSITAVPGIPPFLNVAIHWDKDTNAIWFTEALTNKVGKYSLS